MSLLLSTIAEDVAPFNGIADTIQEIIEDIQHETPWSYFSDNNVFNYDNLMIREWMTPVVEKLVKLTDGFSSESLNYLIYSLESITVALDDLDLSCCQSIDEFRIRICQTWLHSSPIMLGLNSDEQTFVYDLVAVYAKHYSELQEDATDTIQLRRDLLMIVLQLWLRLAIESYQAHKATCTAVVAPISMYHLMITACRSTILRHLISNRRLVAMSLFNLESIGFDLELTVEYFRELLDSRPITYEYEALLILASFTRISAEISSVELVHGVSHLSIPLNAHRYFLGLIQCLIAEMKLVRVTALIAINIYMEAIRLYNLRVLRIEFSTESPRPKTLTSKTPRIALPR